MATVDLGAERDRNLALANAVRAERARVRRDLRTGALKLDEVMRDWPPFLADTPLIDIVRWVYTVRQPRRIAELGRDAVRDGVNLMMPLGRASSRSREWVADRHVSGWRPSSK